VAGSSRGVRGKAREVILCPLTTTAFFLYSADRLHRVAVMSVVIQGWGLGQREGNVIDRNASGPLTLCQLTLPPTLEINLPAALNLGPCLFRRIQNVRALHGDTLLVQQGSRMDGHRLVVAAKLLDCRERLVPGCSQQALGILPGTGALTVAVTIDPDCTC
jgi:hypothetical protein